MKTKGDAVVMGAGVGEKTVDVTGAWTVTGAATVLAVVGAWMVLGPATVIAGDANIVAWGAKVDVPRVTGAALIGDVAAEPILVVLKVDAAL